MVENAIVDGAMVPTGILTTRGYEDTLFATRGAFGRWSGLTEDEKRNPTDIANQLSVPARPVRRP